MLVTEVLDSTFDKMEDESIKKSENNPLTPDLFDIIVEEFEQIDDHSREEFYIKKVSLGEFGGVRFHIHQVDKPNIKYVLEYLDNGIVYWQKTDTQLDTYLEGQYHNPILKFS